MWFKTIKYDQLSDQGLITAFQEKQDQNALAELYGRYVELCFGTCMKYLKSETDSKDAVLDIYESLIKKLPNQEIHNFRPWLYVLVKNHCLGILRKNNRDLTKLSEAAIMYSEQVFHPDDIKKEEQLTQLEKCRQKLIKKQQECIDLFYFQKMTYEEIGKKLELDKNKIRSYIQNGRRNLKNCMDQNLTT